MAPRPIPPELRKKQDRAGQIPRQNTWYDAVYKALPTTGLITTTRLYMAVAETYPSFELQRCKTTLWSLAKRNLVYRQRMPQANNQYGYRKLEL